MDQETITLSLEGNLKREIKILRDLIEILQEENKNLIENRAELIKELTGEREEVLSALVEAKEERFNNIKELIKCLNLNDSEEITEENCLKALETYSENSCGTLKILRDQILDLIERAAVYTERNNYLLKNKANLTKELIEKLHPRDFNTTYGPQGKLGGKAKKVSTVTIINQEG